MCHLKILTLVLCCYLAHARGIFGTEYDPVKAGNDYVDKLLEDIVEEHGHEFDPYNLEDKVIGIWKKVAFMNVSGEAKLHSGVIRGLKTLHRTRNCYLMHNGTRVLVRADLGAGVLRMQYAGAVKFMKLGPTITVHGKAPYIEVEMIMSVNSETGKEGKLEKFRIEEIKGMEIWITGLGPMNWAVNILIKGVNKIFHNYINNLIGKGIANHISKKISNYQFPVKGIVTESTTTVPESTTEYEISTTEPTEETTVEEETSSIVVATETSTAQPETTPVVETEHTTVEEVTETEPTESTIIEEETVETEETTIEEQTEETTVEEQTEETTIEEETEETTIEEETEETTVEEETEETTIEEETEETTVEEETEETTVEEETEETTVEEETEETTVEEETGETTVEEEEEK